MRYSLSVVVSSARQLLPVQPCVFLDALGQFSMEFGSVNLASVYKYHIKALYSPVFLSLLRHCQVY